MFIKTSYKYVYLGNDNSIFCEVRAEFLYTVKRKFSVCCEALRTQGLLSVKILASKFLSFWFVLKCWFLVKFCNTYTASKRQYLVTPSPGSVRLQHSNLACEIFNDCSHHFVRKTFITKYRPAWSQATLVQKSSAPSPCSINTAE